MKHQENSCFRIFIEEVDRGVAALINEILGDRYPEKAPYIHGGVITGYPMSPRELERFKREATNLEFGIYYVPASGFAYTEDEFNKKIKESKGRSRRSRRSKSTSLNQTGSN